MRKFNKNKIIYCVVGFLLLIFAVRECLYISTISPTYDEQYYVSYGYSFLKTGDYRLRKDKTNFVPVFSSLPLLFLKPNLSTNDIDWQKSDTKYLPKNKNWWTLPNSNNSVWMFCLKFLYRNDIPADKIIFHSRLMIIFLSLILGFFVFKWAQNLYGNYAGLLALFLYTSCPNVLAHSGLVTEDLALSLFAFLMLYYLHRIHSSYSVRYILLAGISLGIALNTKYTALLLIPFPFIYGLLNYFVKKPPLKLKKYFISTFFIYFVAFFVILLFYKIFSIREYFVGMQYAMEYIKHGQMTFIAGKYSFTGFWYYFIYVFFLKTPIPVILLLSFWFINLIRQKNTFKEIIAKESYLLLFPIVLMVTASFSSLQIGLRHILPVYPFIFVLCGGILKSPIIVDCGSIKSFLNGKFKKISRLFIIVVLIIWQAIASIKSHPDYLSYFNETIGGSKNGWKYFLDSNYDWGQNLKGLKKFIQEEGVSDVVLSYYGSSLPNYLEHDFQDLFSFGIWGDKKHVNSEHPRKEILAISVTNLQGVYLSKIGVNTFFWLKNKKPIKIIGNTIFVYDITNDLEIHERLAHIYFITGQYKKAIHESKRSLAISPNSVISDFILSLIYVQSKETAKIGMELQKKTFNKPENFKRIRQSLGKILNNQLSRKIYSQSLVNIGIVLIKNKLNSEAELILKLSININPENIYPYLNLAHIYMDKRKFPEAMYVLEQAENKGLTHPNMFYNKAVIYYSQKKHGKSENYLIKTLEIEPNHIYAKQLLKLIKGQK